MHVLLQFEEEMLEPDKSKESPFVIKVNDNTVYDRRINNEPLRLYNVLRGRIDGRAMYRSMCSTHHNSQ